MLAWLHAPNNLAPCRKEMWAAANADGATVLIVPTMPTNAQ